MSASHPLRPARADLDSGRAQTVLTMKLTGGRGVCVIQIGLGWGPKGERIRGKNDGEGVKVAWRSKAVLTKCLCLSWPRTAGTLSGINQ